MQNANLENLIKTNFKIQFVVIKGNQMIKITVTKKHVTKLCLFQMLFKKGFYNQHYKEVTKSLKLQPK